MRIAPFPIKLERRVDIPEELLNEPFTNQDNGLRPEIIKSRPRFLFSIISRTASVVSVGNVTIVDGDHEPDDSIPQKDRSTVSVLSIYDTYGLDVTLAFLEYTYYRAYNEENGSSWLATYLKGSIVMMEPEMLKWVEPITSVHHLMCTLVLDLIQIDAKQPKMTGTLQSEERELPVELLAKIIGREKISSRLDSELRSLRCNSVPTLDEMWRASDEDQLSGWPSVYRSGDKFSLLYEQVEDVEEELLLSREGDIFTLEYLVDDQIEPESGSVLVTFSLRDYEAFFDFRGCNTTLSMLGMIEELQKQFDTITEDNVDEACAWMVQLVYDLKESDTGEFAGLSALRDELQRLLQLAANEYSQKDE